MEKQTREFNEWLDNAELDGHEEVMALYLAVRNTDEHGTHFSCSLISGERYIVKSLNTNQELLLLSEKAKATFLKVIEIRFCDGLDVESWYGFHVNMASPHS